MRRRVRRPRPVARTYLLHKEAARALITERVAYFATAHGFSYTRIAIKNTRRSWGSCSDKGNLNFNYKLLFLPPCLRDYVILHELCHLRVLNHSAAFWAEMVRHMPDALERAATLRRLERTVGTSVGALVAQGGAHTSDCMFGVCQKQEGCGAEDCA